MSAYVVATNRAYRSVSHDHNAVNDPASTDKPPCHRQLECYELSRSRVLCLSSNHCLAWPCCVEGPLHRYFTHQLDRLPCFNRSLPAYFLCLRYIHSIT